MNYQPGRIVSSHIAQPIPFKVFINLDKDTGISSVRFEHHLKLEKVGSTLEDRINIQKYLRLKL